jgi:hypothetical protein
MGFSISWLAVRGKPLDVVLSQLDFQRTGRFEELPEAPFSAISVKGGWHVIISNDYEFIDYAPVEALAESAEVISCGVEEHVMSSKSYGFKNGRRLWSITHDLQKGISHLNYSGKLPRQFATIHKRLKAELADAGEESSDVDFLIDVPLEVAAALTGFVHDVGFGDSDNPKLEIVEPIPPEWELSSETIANLPLPPESTFKEAFRVLNRKKNSFLILAQRGGNFMQCGGSKKECTVEFRIYESTSTDAYKHYVVGHKSGSRAKAIVRMSEGVVHVRKNEILNVHEAVHLFELFFSGSAIPKEFVVREMDI